MYKGMFMLPLFLDVVTSFAKWLNMTFSFFTPISNCIYFAINLYIYIPKLKFNRLCSVVLFDKKMQEEKKVFLSKRCGTYNCKNA